MWPLRRKASIPVERKSSSLLLGLGQAQLTNRNYLGFASEGYSLNAVVHACVTKIATAASSVDLHVYQKDKKGNVRKLDDHPLLDLINRPNPAQSRQKFVQALANFYLIGGNAFVYGNGMESGQPRELQLLDPSKIEVKPGTGLFPTAYVYRPTGQSQTTFQVDQITGTSDILQAKTFNPLDPWYGLAPMTAAAYGVDIFSAGMQWNKKLLDNDCRPSGALRMTDKDGKPADLSDQQYLRLKEEIETKYSGARNAGKPLLLEGGLEWQQLGMNPRDMDFKENMLMAARFAASVYHVPPQLINIPGESTYANYEQAEMSFWANTVLPLLAGFLDDLSRWLGPFYGDGIYLWYDEEMVPALEPLRKAKADRINAAGYMTINEKREAMGLEALTDGGDTVFVPSSSVPLELAGAVDLPEPGSEADEDVEADV